jgi:hypothetical protein
MSVSRVRFERSDEVKRFSFPILWQQFEVNDANHHHHQFALLLSGA